MKIIMNNRVGWISAITAGRVRVDFNNRFAGHNLRYKYKVTSHADKQDKKIEAILEMHYGKVEEFSVKIAKNDVNIKLPDACKYDLGWFQSKYRVVSDLREFAGVNNVQFIEEYVKKVETKDKDTKESKAKDGKATEKSDEKSDKKTDEKKTEDTKDQKKPEENKKASKNEATKDAK
jgi:hypothetical protein